MGLIDTVAIKKVNPIMEDDFEAIPKADYENRLKADLEAILVELQLEIEEMKSYESSDGQDLVMLADIGILFQERIDRLKGVEK